MVLTAHDLKRINSYLRKHKLIEKNEKVTFKRDHDSNKPHMDNWRFYVDKNDGNNHTLSGFSFVEMPGCCGIVISTGVWVDTKYRGKGIGTLLNDIRIGMARADGYSLLLCTDIFTNEPQRKILTKNGWMSLCRFRNRRTGNPINVDCIPLTDEGVTRIADNQHYDRISRIKRIFLTIVKYVRKPFKRWL